MAEPTTLYKAGKAQTVVSPSEVRRLEAEGWMRAAPEQELDADVAVAPAAAAPVATEAVRGGGEFTKTAGKAKTPTVASMVKQPGKGK